MGQNFLDLYLYTLDEDAKTSGIFDIGQEFWDTQHNMC